MKRITLSDIFSKRNVSRAAALLLALIMLTLAGCNNTATQSGNESTQSGSNESTQSGSSDVSGTNSDSSADEDTASNDSNSTVSGTTGGSNTSKIDPLKGNISTEYTQENTTRADADEIETTVDVSKNFQYTGYAQKERDALLKKILNTPNTLDIYDIKGDVYYVSPSGKDSNDGTSPEKAIRTLPAVNGLPLKKGDAVLFERGSIFRMHEAFDCREGITYGSYGEGRKPMFLGSAKNFAQQNWQPSKKKNVWQTSYIYDIPAGGFFNEGEEIGYLKLSLRALAKNTDFYYDQENSVMYLYCDKGNPSNVWDSIDFSQTSVFVHIGTRSTNITIDNLCLRYMGTFGVGADYNNHYITVTNCEIGFIGGAATSGNVRYGNAIQAWCGGSNLKWENNWIYQTWDTATSPQGAAGHALTDYFNISISGNLYEYNNCDIEIWEAGAGMLGVDCARFYNWKMDNNIHRFTSLGWGTRAEEGIRGIQGVHVGQMRDHQTRNFTWNNNIIDCPGDYIFNKTCHLESEYKAFERKNNTYYINQSLRRHNIIANGFMWENGEKVASLTASNKSQLISVFNRLEPLSKVYWYE